MLIAVDCGHCPKSTGASGYLDELTEDRKLGAALKAELTARGHQVIDTTPKDTEAESLSGRAKRANAAKADFFVSLHFNAGGGTGTEVFTTSSSGAKKQAQKASANVAKTLGLKNRGHKTANFTVLVKTDMPAMLVETCFVDTRIDADAWKRVGPEKVAAAIASAIVGGSEEPIVKEPMQDTIPEEATVRLPKLRKGDEEQAVKSMQVLLVSRGYYLGSYGADGVFGDATDKAVRSFQKDSKLGVDGIVGKDTWTALLV